MPHLADTNILLRLVKTDDPAHPQVRAAVTALLAQQERLYYTQQSRREFWNVATRPVGNNGFGLTVAETVTGLTDLDEVFTRLPERPEVGPEWDRLVVHYQVIGRAVHDAQLVASMVANGINRILTLNIADFARYLEISAIHPRDVPATAPLQE